MPDYKCTEQGCSKTFARQTLLNRHLKRVHEKGGDGENGGDGGNGEQFNLKQADQDTFKCGACNAALDGAVTPCPYCGTDLEYAA